MDTPKWSEHMYYKVSIETVTKSQHVYTARWTTMMNKKLFGKEDEWAEAKD